MVRWRFWCPEVRVNTFFLLLMLILQPRTPSRKLRPSQCRARLVAVHVPLLHKSSKPHKTSSKCCRVCHYSLVLTLRWLRGNSTTDVRYEGEIVQRVVTQKVATCIACRYTYIDRSKGYLQIVAMHYGSYQRANKYLYTVVDRPFDMFDFHVFFFWSLRTNPLFIHTPPFLRIFG